MHRYPPGRILMNLPPFLVHIVFRRAAKLTRVARLRFTRCFCVHSVAVPGRLVGYANHALSRTHLRVLTYPPRSTMHRRCFGVTMGCRFIIVKVKKRDLTPR